MEDESEDAKPAIGWASRDEVKQANGWEERVPESGFE